MHNIEKTMPPHTQDSTQQIRWINGHLADETLRYLKTQMIHRCIILTDDHVRPLYANDLAACLTQQGICSHLISIPPGEASKTRATKASIEDQMLNLGCGRDTLMIAIGGGVITDLGGFVAATYARGIPVIYIPTTLLAMVDATIGGKTGVNTANGKNLIGTFTQPQAILMAIHCLSTLPESEYRYAFSEVIKHAVVNDAVHFHELAENTEAVHQQDLTFLKKIIEKSCAIKSDIVAQDTHEKNLRAILNFGHTIGHAIERASDYAIPHGQAVGIGMLVEGEISCKMGLLHKEDLARIQRCITACIGQKWLRTLTITTLSTHEILQALTLDKKSRSGSPRFVLLNGIGQPHCQDGNYTHAVPEKMIRDAVDNIKECCAPSIRANARGCSRPQAGSA